MPAGSTRWPSHPVRLALAAAWGLVALLALTPIARDLNNWMSGTALSGGTSPYGRREALLVYILPLLAFGALGPTALLAGGAARKLTSLWLGLLGAATVVWSILFVLAGFDDASALLAAGGAGIVLGAATVAVAGGAWSRWG